MFPDIKFKPSTIDAILERFEFDLARSEHGILHWCRVMDNGFKLAAMNPDVNPQIVFWFALFHDCCRENEMEDPMHGLRASYFIDYHKDDLFLSDDQIKVLKEACATHSDGVHSDNATIAACHDADRLDLGRVRIRPDARYLTSDAAKDPEFMGGCAARGYEWSIPKHIVARLDLSEHLSSAFDFMS